jgi:cbb3-type cytochrome oxidase subunit 3
MTLDNGHHWVNTSLRYTFAYVTDHDTSSSHEYTWLHYLAILLGSLLLIFMCVWCYFKRRRAAMDNEAYNNIINQLDPALDVRDRQPLTSSRAV